MLKRSWFQIYIFFRTTTAFQHYPISQPKSELEKFNIDLKTYVDIDEKNNDADIKFLIKNHKVIGDVKFIIDEDDDMAFRGRNNSLTFVEFLQNIIKTLTSYNDNNLEYFCAVFDNQIRNYHYQGCRFYELTEIPDFRRFIAQKLEKMRQKPPDVIRSYLAILSDDIEKYSFDNSKRELVTLVNALYKNDEDARKLKIFLYNMETYGKDNRRPVNLAKIIKQGVRSILFDHYTDLPKKSKEVLKTKISEYLKNNLSPATEVLAEITNAMFFDFNLSNTHAGKGIRGFTVDVQNDKLKNKNNLRNLHTTLRRKKQKKHKIKKHHRQIKTDKTKSFPFDEIFQPLDEILDATTPKNRYQILNANGMQLKTAHTSISKTRSSKKQEDPYSIFTTGRTKSKLRMAKTTKTHSSSRTKRIPCTLLYDIVKTETPRYLREATTPRKSFMKIVTMRPYHSRKVTSFGKVQYVIDLNKKDKESKKSLRSRPKVPSFRLSAKEKNIEFYRRKIDQKNNIKLKFGSTQPSDKSQDENDYIEETKNNSFEKQYSNESFSTNLDQNKNNTLENNKIDMGLRINVDDYIKKLKVEPHMLKKDQFNPKPNVRNRDTRKYGNDFIRGKQNNHQVTNANEFISRQQIRNPLGDAAQTYDYVNRITKTNINQNYDYNSETIQKSIDKTKYLNTKPLSDFIKSTDAVKSSENINTSSKNKQEDISDQNLFFNNNEESGAIKGTVESQEEERELHSDKFTSNNLYRKFNRRSIFKGNEQVSKINTNDSKINRYSESAVVEESKEIEDSDKTDSRLKQQSKYEDIKSKPQKYNVLKMLNARTRKPENDVSYSKLKENDNASMLGSIKQKRKEIEKETMTQFNYRSAKSISKHNLEANGNSNNNIYNKNASNISNSRSLVKSRDDKTNLVNTDVMKISSDTTQNPVLSETINNNNLPGFYRDSDQGRDVIGDQDILQNSRRKREVSSNNSHKALKINIRQNNYTTVSELADVVTKSATNLKTTNNTIDHSKETTTQQIKSKTDVDGIGIVQVFELSKEITAPFHLDKIESRLRKIDDEETLHDLHDKNENRRFMLNSNETAADSWVLEDISYRPNSSPEDKNAQKPLFAPPPPAPYNPDTNPEDW